MPRCEDFPCCGHGAGECPRIDRQGRERWSCVECGRELPLKATSSICARCLNRMRRLGDDYYGDEYPPSDY